MFVLTGRYFSATLMLVCLSMVMTVTVLNVHYAHDRYVSPPRWLSKLAFDWLKMFTSKRHRRRPCTQKTQIPPEEKNNFDMTPCADNAKNCNENSSLLKVRVFPVSTQRGAPSNSIHESVWFYKKICQFEK